MVRSATVLYHEISSVSFYSTSIHFAHLIRREAEAYLVSEELQTHSSFQPYSQTLQAPAEFSIYTGLAPVITRAALRIPHLPSLAYY